MEIDQFTRNLLTSANLLFFRQIVPHLTYSEIYYESYGIKTNLDCNYNFLIDLTPNEILSVSNQSVKFKY